MAKKLRTFLKKAIQQSIHHVLKRCTGIYEVSFNFQLSISTVSWNWCNDFSVKGDRGDIWFCPSSGVAPASNWSSRRISLKGAHPAATLSHLAWDPYGFKGIGVWQPNSRTDCSEASRNPLHTQILHYPRNKQSNKILNKAGLLRYNKRWKFQSA